MTIRLALFAASPVHYQAPLYRRIAAVPGIEFEAIFASDQGVRPYDGGFGRQIMWDGDLLDGYRHRFLRRARHNGSAEGLLALRDLDVFRVVRRGRYDVLWLDGYHTLTHLLASLAQRSKGCGLLYREEQTLLHERPLVRRMVKQAVLPFYFRGAGGLYIGRNNLEWFESHGFTSDRLFFTPYCVDNERLEAQANRLRPRKAELVSSFGLDNGKPVILTVCRLVAKKQVGRLIDAFAAVRTQFPCSLLVVGSGPEETLLRRQAQTLELTDVAFAGFLNQDEVGRAYAAADIFVLPSRIHETFGLVVNEAMNFGLPIVVSDKVGCGVDLVHPGENGFVFDSSSTGQLTNRLLDLLRDQDMRRRMGERSAQIIAKWNYEAVVKGLLEGVSWASRRADTDALRARGGAR